MRILQKKQILFSSRILLSDGTRGVSQAVEYLPQKCKTLSSNPQYHQKIKQNRIRRENPLKNTSICCKYCFPADINLQV
jgi:hypothetical protein